MLTPQRVVVFPVVSMSPGGYRPIEGRQSRRANSGTRVACLRPLRLLSAFARRLRERRLVYATSRDGERAQRVAV